MKLSKLYQELEDLNPVELDTIQKLVQALKRTRESPLAYIEELMNFRVCGYNEEKNVYEHKMLVTDELKNRFKILHGGIMSTFMDTAMGSTVFQLAGESTQAVTLELTVHFILPAVEGWLTAETEVIKEGKTIILMGTKVTDEKGKLIASASSTFFRLK